MICFQRIFSSLCAVILFFTSCAPEVKQSTINPERIVSLDGSLTEIIAAIGFEKNIVGVDVTSTYPASVNALPKASHTRTVNPEAVIAMKPTVIFAFEKGMKAEVEQQLRSAGIPLVILKKEYDIQGTKHLIKQVADTLGKSDKVDLLWKQIDTDLATVKSHEESLKVPLLLHVRDAI